MNINIRNKPYLLIFYKQKNKKLKELKKILIYYIYFDIEKTLILECVIYTYIYYKQRKYIINLYYNILYIILYIFKKNFF